jgi:hypothetical protein
MPQGLQRQRNFAQVGASTPTIHETQFVRLWVVRSSPHRNYFMNPITCQKINGIIMRELKVRSWIVSDACSLLHKLSEPTLESHWGTWKSSLLLGFKSLALSYSRSWMNTFKENIKNDVQLLMGVKLTEHQWPRESFIWNGFWHVVNEDDLVFKYKIICWQKNVYLK